MDLENLLDKKTTLISIGNNVNKLMNQINQNDFSNISFNCINNDDLIKNKFSNNNINYNESDIKTNQIYEKNNFLNVNKNTNEQKKEIRKKLIESKLLILVIETLDNSNNEILNTIIEMAKEEELLILAISITTTLEVSKENKIKEKLRLAKLNKQIDSLIVLSDQKLRDNYYDIDTIQMTEIIKINLEKCLNVFNGLISKNLNIDLDFANLSMILRNSELTHINFSRVIGKKKLKNVVNNLQESKVIASNSKDVNTAIVNITSDYNFHINDLEEITNDLKDMFSQDLNIFYTLNIDENLMNEVQLSFIATSNNIKNTINNEINKSNILKTQEIISDLKKTLEINSNKNNGRNINQIFNFLDDETEKELPSFLK